jgi:hypothetical protein
MFVAITFSFNPLTFQTTAWYASTVYATLMVVAAMALYGFWTSLGGRPRLGIAGVDD